MEHWGRRGLSARKRGQAGAVAVPACRGNNATSNNAGITPSIEAEKSTLPAVNVLEDKKAKFTSKNQSSEQGI
jgi:hypothetical protein